MPTKFLVVRLTRRSVPLVRKTKIQHQMLVAV
jgi:hypothetical protein